LTIQLLKNLALVAILSIGILSIGLVSIAEAHPHPTLDSVNAHSHVLHTSNDFIIHTFDRVVLFVGEIQSLIFG